jgi:hypothetical protein
MKKFHAHIWLDRCGRLFCSQHCACAMRLDRNARHDPKNGRWYRVCDDCFQAREGYGEHEGKLAICQRDVSMC